LAHHAAVKRDLPSGTVTFLFSDIEGSTRLLDELGADRYSKALAEHRRLIRGACARFGGVEVDTEGDAMFVAFPTAPGAVGSLALHVPTSISPPASSTANLPAPDSTRPGGQRKTPLSTEVRPAP
jgi:class 3 adenylate cyclase